MAEHGGHGKKGKGAAGEDKQQQQPRGGGAGKKDSQVPNREAFERMSFLFQAAHLCLTQPAPNVALCRHYVHTLRTIARRLVLRLDPSMKRAICQKCEVLLVPGITCRVRVQPRKRTHVVQTCIPCGHIRRYLTREDYCLWSDRPSSLQNYQADKGDKGEREKGMKHSKSQKFAAASSAAEDQGEACEDEEGEDASGAT